MTSPLHRLLPLLTALAIAATPAAQAAPAPAGAAAKAAAQKKTAAKTRKAPPKPPINYAGDEVNFGEWQGVVDFEDDMVARHGMARAELDAIVAQLRLVDAAIELVKPGPPGKPKNWQAYSARFIEPVRINAGVRFWNENAELLGRAEVTYGVPAEIIVGILGVETVYGQNTGRFRVMDVLASLAFAYPDTPNRSARMAFFRGELENTLLLAQHNHIDPFSLIGSYAGAVGLPQFMPGSILKFGVDFDGDGAIDLRNSIADAIGSVANFLVAHGWQRNAPGAIVYPANVSPARAWERFIGLGLAASVRPDELASAGVVTATPLPPDLLYGLIDLQNGAEATEYWVASDNFYAITQYNRSYFYAMSVIELGRAVRLSR
jgi:membrane-bound lytic murein transglycosylase B